MDDSKRLGLLFDAAEFAGLKVKLIKGLPHLLDADDREWSPDTQLSAAMQLAIGLRMVLDFEDQAVSYYLADDENERELMVTRRAPIGLGATKDQAILLAAITQCAIDLAEHVTGLRYANT